MPAQRLRRHLFCLQQLDRSKQIASVLPFLPILAAADPKLSQIISGAPVFGTVAQ